MPLFVHVVQLAVVSQKTSAQPTISVCARAETPQSLRPILHLRAKAAVWESGIMSQQRGFATLDNETIKVIGKKGEEARAEEQTAGEQGRTGCAGVAGLLLTIGWQFSLLTVKTA